MQKLGLSGLRSLEGFRSLAGSTSTAVKAANPKPSSDAGGSTYGSFANLKITAEKLVKEQASVKTDLEMASPGVLDVGRRRRHALIPSSAGHRSFFWSPPLGKFMEKFLKRKAPDSTTNARNSPTEVINWEKEI